MLGRICLLAGLLMLAPLHAQEPCSSLTSMDWLLGSWHTQTDKNRIEESWSRVSDHTFEGTGTTFDKQGNITFTESLRMVMMQGEVFYLAKVSHNSLPVAFKLVNCEQTRWVFENASHDFPQRLSYTLSDQAMTVRAENLAGKGFSLNFRRQ